MSKIMNIGLGLAVVFPVAAYAYPPGWYGEDCDSGEGDICTLDGAYNYTCDITRTTGTKGGIVWAVYDDGGVNLCNNDNYCVWGWDEAGVKFYCDELDVDRVTLNGTEYSDDFHFQYDYSVGGIEHEFNLNDDGDENFFGLMYGFQGADELLGSRIDSSDYTDSLHGGDDGDGISGDGGADLLFGDAGNDYIYGDGGDTTDGFLDYGDTIDGGSGNDWIWGGDDEGEEEGGDTINGGPDADHIAGEAGDDTIYGDSGTDYLCGDDGHDHLYGYDNNDVIWAGGDTMPTYETIVGGNQTDHCQNTGDVDCEYTDVTSRPMDCPSI